MSNLNEVCQTLSNVIEKLISMSKHKTLWDGIDLWRHLKITVAFQVNQQDSEVCAAKIKCKKFATLCSIWQVLHVCHETFDLCCVVRFLLEAFIDLFQKDFHHFLEGVIAQIEFLAAFSDL